MCSAAVLGLKTDSYGQQCPGNLSVERLKPWLDGCISLSWKAEPRRIKDWPIPSIVKNISSPGLAFVHIMLQVQNTDLSSVKANKQKIFTVLL